MKKSEVIEFFKRGFTFGGTGCIIVGFIIWMISLSTGSPNLEGWQIFLAIVSGFLLAFIQAATTVFHQIERWSPIKSAGLQLLCLYVVYLGSYLANSWIPFNWLVIVVFTAIFIAVYFIIWITVYLIIKNRVKKLNQNLVSDEGKEEIDNN